MRKEHLIDLHCFNEDKIISNTLISRLLLQSDTTEANSGSMYLL